MRTFDKETYLAAKRAWDTGGFGPQWREVRAISWEYGYPYPPSGDPYDDRDDPEPSQRAIIWRALDYRPIGTIAIVRESRSWHEVVERIIAEEHRLKGEADHHDELASEERASRPTHRDAVSALAEILKRIDDSR